MTVQEKRELLKTSAEKIEAAKSRIEADYTDLGRAVYAAAGTELSDPAAKAIAEKIRGEEAEIEAIRAEMQAIEAVPLCAVCGREIKESDAFCPWCGTRTNADVEVKEASARAFCPFCGEKVEAEQAFCSNCGGRLGGAPAAAMAEEPAAESEPERAETETGSSLFERAAEPEAEPETAENETGSGLFGRAAEPLEEAEPQSDAYTQQESAYPVGEKAAGPVICTNCGQELTAEDAFCYNCGQKVMQAVPVSPEAQADAGPSEPEIPAEGASADGEFRCPNCGTVCEDGQLFCMECGTRLD